MDLQEESYKGRFTEPVSGVGKGHYQPIHKSIMPTPAELIDYIGVLEDCIADSCTDVWEHLDLKNKVWKES